MSENKFENGLGEENVSPEADNMNADENKISEADAPAEREIADEIPVELNENPDFDNGISSAEENPMDMHPTDDGEHECTAAVESEAAAMPEEKVITAYEEAPDNASLPTEHAINEDELSSEEAVTSAEDELVSEKTDAKIENELSSAEEIANPESEEDTAEDSAAGTDEANADEVIGDSQELTATADASETDADEETEDKNEETEEKKKDKKPGSRGIDSLFDFVELFIFSLAAVFIITTFFFRHSVVEGSSMERTLFEGEHIIISDLFYTPKRGDIVVCEDYSLEHEYMRKPIVKRVIAIAGDTVKIDRYGNVYVNGELLDESDYVYTDGPVEIPQDIIDKEITIEEGEIFVMGDHRNNSADSRTEGPIKEDSILGKILIRFYPFEKFGRVD